MTNPDFQELLGYRSYDWPCKVCTSKVNWLEYLRQRRELVQEIHSRIIQTARDVEKLQLPQQETTSLTTLAGELLKQVDQLEAFYQEKATAVDLAIIPISTKIPMDLLVSLAIDNVPPFERKNEKGFRDAVSLLSLFEYAREQKFSDVLIISYDTLFGEAANRFAADYKLDMKVVKTIPDANNAVGFDASWIRQRYQMYANWGAMDYLETRLDMLTKLVADINPYDRIKYAQQYLSFSENQRKVLLVDSMRFKTIAAASHDYRGTDAEALFFRLECEMDLLLQMPTENLNAGVSPAEYLKMPIELYGSVNVRQENGIVEIGPANIDQAAPPAKVETIQVLEPASDNSPPE